MAACPGNRASVDVVCAFQSIEHMADVTEVVLALKTMLKPSGLVILSVPHGPAIEFNERHLSSFDMPPNHVGRWYRETFAALCARTGLELVAHEIEPRRRWQLLREVMELYIHGLSASKPRSLAGRAQAIQNRRRPASALSRRRKRYDDAFAARGSDPGLGYSQLAVLRIPQQRVG
jgi:SAM-dependent methyltransferase